jgi:hypothetical protein
MKRLNHRVVAMDVLSSSLYMPLVTAVVVFLELGNSTSVMNIPVKKLCILSAEAPRLGVKSYLLMHQLIGLESAASSSASGVWGETLVVNGFQTFIVQTMSSDDNV